MGKFILRRLLTLIPVMFLVGAITFILMRSAPGGPWDTSAERRQVDASTMRSLTSYYGLDKPIWRQFTRSRLRVHSKLLPVQPPVWIK